MLVENDTISEQTLVSDGPPASEKEIRFLLTGFGPFSRSDGTKITSNPSFAAIRPLTDTLYITPEGHKVRFSTIEIPVSYEIVDRLVPGLHEGGYQFILHVGVGRNGYITLEKYGCSGGYFRQDIVGALGPLPGSETFCTKLDVESLEARLQAMGYKYVIASDDAGRYLCEYIYFRSMQEATKSGIPVLFCHVPTEGKPYDISEMTEVLVMLAMLMVDMKESGKRTSGERRPHIYPAS